MSGMLALVGGQEWTPGCTFDELLLERSGTDRVLLIPTAAAYEQPSELIERAEGWFGSLGASVDVLDVYRRAAALDDGVAEKIAAAKFVYVAGGSPMHLRSVLKDTPMWSALVSMWRAGGVLAGSAEGAMVLSTHMVDARGGAFTVGLDLLDEVTVIPRFNLWSGDKLHRTIRLAPSHLFVAGIDERTALIWDGAEWSSSGAGVVTVHRAGHRVSLSDLPALS